MKRNGDSCLLLAVEISPCCLSWKKGRARCRLTAASPAALFAMRGSRGGSGQRLRLGEAMEVQGLPSAAGNSTALGTAPRTCPRAGWELSILSMSPQPAAEQEVMLPEPEATG